jgi:hypothetical protein
LRFNGRSDFSIVAISSSFATVYSSCPQSFQASRRRG